MKILNVKPKLKNILNSLNATHIKIKHAFFTCKINNLSITAYKSKNYDNIDVFYLYYFSQNQLIENLKCNIKTLKQTLIGIGIIK